MPCLSLQSLKRSILSIFLLATLSGNTFALSAVESGSLTGKVIDTQGAAVAKSRVILLDAIGVIRQQTYTNDEGNFAFGKVAAGDYLIQVEANGFAQKEKQRVSLGANGTEAITITLTIAAITDYVIVTDTRTGALEEQLAGASAVITAEDLQRISQSQISEPLRLLPGLQVVQTSGRGGITSIFTRGGESDYNKVLIDGVPVNAAGGAFDFAFLTPENFARVEVVKGARSALFGSDAMTSVVQLITHRGTTATPALELSAEGGSFDFHRETARLSGIQNWFDYSASFGFLSTDSRIENNDFINRSASANLGFRFNSMADLRVTSRFNDNELGISGPTANLFADPDQRQSHKDLALGATFEWKTTARWQQSVRGIYSEFDTFSFDPIAQDLTKPERPPLPPFSFGDDFTLNFREHQKRAGVHYQTIAALNRHNLFTAGLDYENEAAVFTDEFSRVSPSRNNVGIYFQDQFSWHDRVFINGGVRIERNSGDVPEDLRAALAVLGSTAPIGDVGFGVSANPHIALSAIVRPHQEDALFGITRLSASFNTGIKEPSLVESFSPNLFFLGNPALNPERVIAYDFGIVQEFYHRRVALEANYFDNRFRDLIVFRFDPATFGPIQLPDGRLTNFINLERASARGVELTGRVRPTLKLALRASYTYLDSQLDRAANALSREIGLPLIRRPRHAGAFEVSWVEQQFDLSVTGSLVGERRDLDAITGARFNLNGRPIINEGYAKLNASGSYRLNRYLSLFMRLENFLNDDYEEALGFPAYRLNFSCGVRVRFGGGL